MVSATFLVVESDNSIRALIGEILTSWGFAVHLAASTAELMPLLDNVVPDGAFVDADLGDCVEILQRYKTLSLRGFPHVIVVDGSVDRPAVIAERFAALTCLKKPIDKNWLELVVKQMLAVRAKSDVKPEDVPCFDKTFLGALLDSSEGAVFVLDADCVVMEANEAGLTLIQVPAEEVLERKYFPLLPPLSSELQTKGVVQARKDHLPQRIEEYRAGAVYITRIIPVIQRSEVVGYVIATRDITDQRRSEVGLVESEKRYRSVYEAAKDAIIMLDRNDGTILDCNVAARRLYGYTSEEMLRLTIRDLSDEPERSMDAIRSVTERVPLTYHRKANGSTFPVEISMSHFVHGGREVCTSFIQDISQRKVVEEALREGARLYRAVVEDQTELICRYTPQGQLTFVNRAYAKFFAVDEDDVVGKSFFPPTADDERRDLRTWLKEAEAGRTVFDREQHVKRHDSEPRWLLWTNRAILDHRGNVVEIQAVGRDITERREAEQALGKATAEREQYRLNLEATFRSIPDAIITVDSDLRVIATNSAAGTLLGLDRGKVKNRGFYEFADSGNPCLSVLKQVLRTSKSVRSYEAELDVPSLGMRTVELNCTPLVDHQAEYIGAVLVVRDVSRIADLEKRLHERHGFRGIIGRSSRMQDMYKLLEQLSSLDSIVLILGESGTGKELVAEALHYGGPRAGAPLIKVNCSALSESLLESELFGHIRGAFTGAVRDKVGRIQAAQGGTLFLDEIGDISPLIQLKLLRFLEQKEYERVGESKTRSADVRILAATNVHLREAVRTGAFREDLYYRLNVMPVQLPPLRERQADIPLLVDHFLEFFSGQFNKTFSAVSNEVMDLFMSYPWPGNIRELRHLLEHACILSSGDEIELIHIRRDLVEQMRGSVFSGQSTLMPQPLPYGSSLVPSAVVVPPARKAGKQEVLCALADCGGNKAMAARMLGIHRATLYRKLRGWGLDG